MSQFARELGVPHARYGRYERAEVEPPLQMLRDIRMLTGISLDWLVADLPEGVRTLLDAARTISIGQRLRWARETQEPWLNACAAVMHIPAQQWERYEQDDDGLPVEVAMEFAHRFSVSLDYLYAGKLAGVAPAVMKTLLARHPELRGVEKREPAPPEGGTSTATDDGNKPQAIKPKMA